VEQNFLKMKRCLLSAFAVGLCLSANVMAQVPSYVPTNGLVGWWPFNGNANDESGNGNNGTVNGATLTTDRNGVASKAYNFNGVNNSIDIGNPATLGNNPQNYTQSAWAQYQDFPTTLVYNLYPMISKRHQNNGSDWATPYLNPNGQIVFVADDQFYQNSIPAYSNVLNIDQWYHFTFVKSNNNYSIYVNGILINSSIDNHIMEGSTDNILIGAQLAWNQYNKGQLDDIGIWNRALTQEEITNLYNGCSASTITSQPSNQAVNPTTSAQFIVNATSGSSFQWQTDLGFGFQNLSNAGQYSGANNDTLVVSNASTSNNNQQFRCIVNPAGCADTSNIAVLTVSTVGMDELSVQGNVSLYPNPTQSSFEIQTSLVYSKIEIRDMQGRIVKTENAAKTINLSSLQKGTYSVNLLDEKENTLAVRKIVLQ
jgi:hypothetical protein